MESTAELVVHAAVRHPIERRRDDFQQLLVARVRVLAQQDTDGPAGRELRCLAKATPLRIEGPLEFVRRPGQNGRVDRPCRHGVASDSIPDRAGQFFGAALNTRRVLAPGLSDVPQELPESRPAVTVVGWEVGSAMKRSQVRSEEHVERPPSAARHQLHGRHVDLIQIRPLLAIDLDGYEVRV